MTDRRARATKADIRRAIEAAKDAGASMAVEIKPDGTIRLVPAVAVKPVDFSGDIKL